ncbi:MAG: PhzF family phenazine biosynthesis protein [Chitinophagaceae bacterium]
MKITITHVDAFTKKIFSGNPAAVCVLDQWLEDSLMQKIGMENNLSETAFLVKDGDAYHIRWFTPTVEVNLCGHATLASAKVLFDQPDVASDEIIFHSKSGQLKVKKEMNGKLTLDFPASIPALLTDPPASILEGLKIRSDGIYKGPFDYMVVASDQAEIESLEPDFKLLATLQSRGIVVTAPGNEVDFVSRCFYPQSGIDEDPVTGSAHTMMTPYWAKKLGKNKLSAIQLSKRKGYLDCVLAGDRVLMSGFAVTFMKGEIDI